MGSDGSSGGLVVRLQAMANVKVKLGARIKEFRDRAGMTAETMADLIKVHPNTIYSIERGKNWVSPEMLDKICHILRVTPDVLFADLPARVEPNLDEAFALIFDKLGFQRPTLRRKDDSIDVAAISRDILTALVSANEDKLHSVRLVLGLTGGLTAGKAGARKSAVETSEKSKQNVRR